MPSRESHNNGGSNVTNRTKEVVEVNREAEVATSSHGTGGKTTNTVALFTNGKEREDSESNQLKSEETGQSLLS